MAEKRGFTESEIKMFEPSEKIGIVACSDMEGKPHIALLTSIMAVDENTMSIGQFCLGRSKWYIKENKKMAFLILTLNKKFWMGKAVWTHERLEGPEYNKYNNMPLFRYNSYFGINKVHYLDLIEKTDGESLPMGGIVRGAILTKMARGRAATGGSGRVLRPFAENLINKLDSLKFLSYIGAEGFPEIIPVVQCQAADSRRLVFNPSVYKEKLKNIPAGSTVAVYGMNFSMQSVLVRGVFTGYRKYMGITLGAVDIDWVYNSMPPIHDQIYPEQPIETVVNF